MCPQKKLGIVIPFKEVIKRALGFVRGVGRGEKEKKTSVVPGHIHLGSWSTGWWQETI